MDWFLYDRGLRHETIKAFIKPFETLQSVKVSLRPGPRQEGWRDHLQISLLILRKFKQINRLIFPLESSENQRFANNFRRNRSYVICLKTLNIRSKIWRQSLTVPKNAQNAREKTHDRALKMPPLKVLFMWRGNSEKLFVRTSLANCICH